MNQLPIEPVEPTGPHIPEASRGILDPLPVPPPVRIPIPWYARYWFVGGVFIAGGVLSVIPATTWIGVGVVTVAGGYFGKTALGYTARRAGKEDVWQLIIEAIRAALEALKDYIQKENKKCSN
jgi:hypothetical protein